MQIRLVHLFVLIAREPHVDGWLAPELKRLNTMPQSDGRLLVADAAYSSRARSAHGFNAHVRAYPLSRPHCRVYIANWIPSFLQFLFFPCRVAAVAAGLLADWNSRWRTLARGSKRNSISSSSSTTREYLSLSFLAYFLLLVFSSLLFAPVSRAFIFSL